MGFIIVYVTYKDMDEAKKIISFLIKEKLISCANLFPVTSCYWWKDSIEDSKEIISILKTQSENWKRIEKEIKRLHSYEVPCIVRIDAEANEDFEKWIFKTS